MQPPDDSKATRSPRTRQCAGGHDVEEFEVVAHGLFSKSAVSVEYWPEAFRPEPPVEAFIEATWDAYRRTSADAGIELYNGLLFRLDHVEQTGSGLRLTLSDTDFRACIGTASDGFASAFPGLPRANPLTVSVALICSDGMIAIERRSRVDGRRRPYHVIAGYMERDRDASADTRPHPFDTLAREVREELGVDIDPARLHATGLIRTVYGSEMCFRCRVDLPFDRLCEMQAGPGTDSEIETLEPVEDSPSALAAFLAAHPAELVPSGRACLLLYGRDAYGEAWYHGASRQGE